MPDRPQDRESRLISEEAADWFSCLKQEDLSVSERQQYVRWLKQSPKHIAEMLKLWSLEALLRATDLKGLPSQEETWRQEASNVIDGAFRQIEPAETPSDAVQRPESPWKLTAS
jgi:ferric-dicitrate binding protein FerR (iron transport regulator)